jgi:hypothetical protein
MKIPLQCLIATFLLHACAAFGLNIGVPEVLSSADNGNGNLLLVQKTTLSQTATIQSLTFYVTTAGGSLILGIYDGTGSNGKPGNLLASTASFTPKTGWNTAPVKSQVSLPSGTYWLAYLPSSSSLAFGKRLTGPCYYYYYSFGAMPQLFGSKMTSTTTEWSLYATLNPTPTPPPLVLLWFSMSRPPWNATV